MKLNILALIPARGGSKGIFRKNLKLMNGLPLIQYAIDSALNSKMISRVIVSSEDNEILKLSKNLGAEVPFIRPLELAKDESPDFPLISHAINYLKEFENYEPDLLVYLRPTMPTRQSKEIDNVINYLIKKKVDCVRTTRLSLYPPYWMKKINKDGFIEPYDKNVTSLSKSRRQDLPATYMCDGYVDVAKVKTIIKENNFPTNKTLPYLIDSIPYFDLDTPEDWFLCESYMRSLT